VDGKPPDSAEWFCKWLEEASNDFRVQKSLLSGLDYAVFGLGNSLYKERFNMVSIKDTNFRVIQQLLSCLNKERLNANC